MNEMGQQTINESDITCNPASALNCTINQLQQNQVFKISYSDNSFNVQKIDSNKLLINDQTEMQVTNPEAQTLKQIVSAYIASYVIGSSSQNTSLSHTNNNIPINNQYSANDFLTENNNNVNNNNIETTSTVMDLNEINAGFCKETNIIDNYNNNDNFNNENILLGENSYDYANPVVVADGVDVHGKELAEKAFNFWSDNVQSIQRGDQMSQDIPINTTHHGILRYTVTISKDQQGNATMKIHGSSADEDLNSVGRNTCYANMITRDARHKLLVAGYNVDVSDDVKLTKDQAYQDDYFTNLEQAIRDAPGMNETLPIEDAQNLNGAHSEIYKIANVNDVIDKITIPELRADLEYMKSIGCTRFVVWKMPNSHFVRFDGLSSEGFIDFFDVIGYDVGRLNLQPEVQYVEEPQIEYVEQPQIEYVEQPQLESVNTMQFQINASQPPIMQPNNQIQTIENIQREKQDRFGEMPEDEEELVFNGYAPIRTMRTVNEPQLGILRRNYRMPVLGNTQEDEFNDEALDDLEEVVNEEKTPPPREFNVKIRPSEKTRNDGPKERESAQNIFNIKTVEGANSAPGTATQHTPPAETTARPETQDGANDLRQPIVVLGNPGQVLASPNSAPTAKGEEVRVDINHDPIKE